MHILWIKTELLHPVDKGGRIRTYQMLRELKRSYQITYLTLDDGTAAPDALERATEYCHQAERVPFHPPAKGTAAFYLDLARNVVSPLPYAVAKYRSAAMQRRVEELCRGGGVDLVVCDFLFPSINVPTDTGIPTVLFEHNVEAMIWERHAAVAKDPVRRTYLGEQWRRMLRWERAECSRFDHVVAVSEPDAAVFLQQFGARSVSHVSTGVDTAYFRPTGQPRRNPHELVFTGSMDWMPNEDAVRYFAAEILPRVRRRVPEATLTVVGRNPTPAVRALADAEPAISVTGAVPDVRPYIERAAAFVVPIRVGGGTRLKIFEAMGMECPVVSTTVGAEGLPVSDGRDIILADTPDAFADAVVRLMTDSERAAELARAAADGVRTRHGWSAVAQQFGETCERVARATPGARAGVARLAS